MPSFVTKGQATAQLLKVMDAGGERAEAIGAEFAPRCNQDASAALIAALEVEGANAIRSMVEGLIVAATPQALFQGADFISQGSVLSTGCVGNNTVANVANGAGGVTEVTIGLSNC